MFRINLKIVVFRVTDDGDMFFDIIIKVCMKAILVKKQQIQQLIRYVEIKARNEELVCEHSVKNIGLYLETDALI